MGVAPGLPHQTAHELWAHARELAERAVREFEPADARRALVTLAIAGSGGDRRDLTGYVALVHHSLVKLAIDPVGLFDAASALVDRDDHEAREVLVTFARRPPRERSLEAFGWREGRDAGGFRYEPVRIGG